MKKITVICLVMLAVIIAVFANPLPALAAGYPALETIQIIPPDPSLPEEIKYFSGFWEGMWSGSLGMTPGKLIVSEVKQDYVIATIARDKLVARYKEKATIKPGNDGKLLIEFAMGPGGGTVSFVAHPEEGTLVGTALAGRYPIPDVVTMKKK